MRAFHLMIYFFLFVIIVAAAWHPLTGEDFFVSMQNIL